MRKKIELTNDFHNTIRTVIVPADGLLNAQQCRRIKRDLCSDIACTCSGVLGERGEQDLCPTGTQIETVHDDRTGKDGVCIYTLVD
jgi:hypothetical protein